MTRHDQWETLSTVKHANNEHARKDAATNLVFHRFMDWNAKTRHKKTLSQN